MTIVPFMGVNIALNAFERDGQPGLWWPRATLSRSSTGEVLDVISPAEHFPTAAEADACALRLARRHINKTLHQG